MLRAIEKLLLSLFSLIFLKGTISTKGTMRKIYHIPAIRVNLAANAVSICFTNFKSIFTSCEASRALKILNWHTIFSLFLVIYNN